MSFVESAAVSSLVFGNQSIEITIRSIRIYPSILRQRSIGITVLLLLAAYFSQGQTFTPGELAHHSSEISGAKPARPLLAEVVSRALGKENVLVDRLRYTTPIIETYIQQMKNDPELGLAPFSDLYFLGYLNMRNGVVDHSLLPTHYKLVSAEHSLISRLQAHYSSGAFTHELFLQIDPLRYKFEFVRRELLGEVRCFVVDVRPQPGESNRRFLGRIWIEDRDYNIVRFQGVYLPSIRQEIGQFDSWRVDSGGMWLPAFIYGQEERARSIFSNRSVLKVQTRLWNYKLSRERADQALVAVTSQNNQKEGADDEDANDPPEHSILFLHRNFAKRSADNVIERLQRAGLIATHGETERVLETVLNNLILSANLKLDFKVKIRVLLTTPLESTTVDHTILLSRGLIDILPDEATLAAVLAHELAHTVLGHAQETKFASESRLRFDDLKIISRMQLWRNSEEERAADDKAIEILRMSPYSSSLPHVGLFLRMLASSRIKLPNLMLPLLGNGMSDTGKYLRLSVLMHESPDLKPGDKDQIAALPLGSRIIVDPWSDQVRIFNPVSPQRLTAHDKMALQITPMMLHLVRKDLN